MSIYFQLTTRCNMHCAHCGFACTRRGKDMSDQVFRRALAFAVRHNQMVTLGGGEPTLHPQFWPWLQYARKRLYRVSDDLGSSAIGLVTNGSRTEDALKLAQMASEGKIWAAVSKDPYHDPIAPAVFQAFDKPRYPSYDEDLWRLPHDARIAEENRRRRDLRDIRTVRMVRRAGRAKKWGHLDGWCCGMHLDPDGKLWECTCRTVLICDFAVSAGRKVHDIEVYNDYSCTKDRLKYEEKDKAA